MTRKKHILAGLILSLLALGMLLGLLSGCGRIAATDATDPVSSSVSDTLPPTTAPLSSTTEIAARSTTTATTAARIPVSEPQFGETMPLVPEEILLSEDALGFVPPETLPLFRIVFKGPLTSENMDAVADKLGLGEPRTYSSSAVPAEQGAVSDGRWSIIFFRGDLNCFHLSDPMASQEVTEGFEEGVVIEAVSPEEAVAVADGYLASLGYGAELGPPKVFDRMTRERREGDSPISPTVSYVVVRGVGYGTRVGGLPLKGASVVVDVGPGGRVMSLSHTIQQTEPDEAQATIVPVEVALEDVRSGKGQFPAQADMEKVSRLIVESIELAYFSPPEGLEETHYKPVYVFHVLMADSTRGEWLVSAYRETDGAAVSALPTPEEWTPEPWMQPELLESYRAAYRDNYEATMVGGGPTVLPSNMSQDEVIRFHGER